MRIDTGLARIMWAINGPIITYPGFESCVPDNLIGDIKFERLLANLRYPLIEEATDVEAMIYIMTATLAQPPAQDIVVVYTHLFQEYSNRKGVKLPDSLKDSPYHKELNEQQKQWLRGLKEWLFKTSFKEVKAKIKAGQSKEPEPLKIPCQSSIRADESA